jgi:hypothetical protein
MGRSAYHLTRGPQATTMHFWPLLHTTLIRMAIWVSLFLLFLVRMLILPGLEELLIDFCELVGEHSGENMAEVVWETLVRYGIHGRVSTNSRLTSIFINFLYLFCRSCLS